VISYNFIETILIPSCVQIAEKAIGELRSKFALAGYRKMTFNACSLLSNLPNSGQLPARSKVFRQMVQLAVLS